ncbi:helix-turn-helix domain-containing protein [Cryptosporangium phraense]|uniref:Uncharacterized protein n=1 Tax=Cryptosporangium phraense TaxID=2593070 RepID=A0A545AFD6_9ACTN|nr:hypothetical protein [Cryptosporangium phraense]TQS40023.1 hypothetical protein FL583_36930 [Cryptosporangium phraense]
MAGKTKLRLAREAEGWTQERLIREMRWEATRLGTPLPEDASLKVYVSRWESGHTRVTKPEYRELFRTVYTATDAELGFDLGTSPSEEQAPATPVRPVVIDGQVLDYYSGVLRQHVHGDNLLGAASVLRAAEQQAAVLTDVLATLPRGRRNELAQLVCRYDEFLGWLHQDTGDTTKAMQLTDRASGYGLEIDDPALSAYLLMRKSNIASDAGEHDLAVVLAEASQRLARTYPRLHAVTLRQKANACAAVGDEAGCSAALDLGFEVVEADDPVGLELAPYCTPEYFAMEAAACLTELQRPDQAVYTLQRGMSS